MRCTGRIQISVLLGAVAVSGAVPAGEPDAFLTRLADSSLLTPHFRHLDAVTLAEPAERDGTSGAWPVFQAEARHDPRRLLTTQALSMAWQHSFEGGPRFSFGARLSDQTNVERGALAASGSGASLGLSQPLGGDALLSGQLFLGDEDSKARANGYGARRYYGMSFEGRTALWHDHTPFASLSWQRNDYDGLEPSAAPPGSALRSESISRFAAGWAWQVSPEFDMRAEAQYRLTDEVVDPAAQDRLQLYFRSRYGFR